MADRISSADDQEFIHKLRFLLFSKISEEWDIKWKKKHGETFLGIKKLKSKDAFYDDLLIDICAYLNYLDKKNGGAGLKEYPISKYSIQRFLVEKNHYGFYENTLNIFAIYCGYIDWIDFKTKNTTQPPPVPQKIFNVYTLITTPSQLPDTINEGYVVEVLTRRKTYKFWLLVLFALCLVSFGAYYYWYKYLPFRQITREELAGVKFEVSTQSNDHNPSIIFFDYDFSKLKLDSLKIDFGGNRGIKEQTFEVLKTPRGRLRFDFYKPGVHNVSLYHQKQLLKTIQVFLKSHGWACWYDRVEWRNTNFPYKDFYNNGTLFLHPDKIKNVNHRNDYFLNTVIAKDFGSKLDSIRLEYDIKYSPDDFAISCYGHSISFFTEKGNRVDIFFDRRGCTETTAKNGKATIESYKSQRFYFTRLFYEWARVKIEFKNSRLIVWINDELITDSIYESDKGEFRTLMLHSKGSAMYDNVRLSNSYTNKLILFDDFNTMPVSTDGY